MTAVYGINLQYQSLSYSLESLNAIRVSQLVLGVFFPDELQFSFLLQNQKNKN